MQLILQLAPMGVIRSLNDLGLFLCVSLFLLFFYFIETLLFSLC